MLQQEELMLMISLMSLITIFLMIQKIIRTEVDEQLELGERVEPSRS